jgi:hypothetical protein
MLNFSRSKPWEGIPTHSYPQRTIRRAARALSCSPFRLPLLRTLQIQSVDLKTIAHQSGFQASYTHYPVPQAAAENSLLWLIQVGVLRREVDGQGITDSFRLTPLGHLLLEAWRSLPEIPQPSGRDRLYNALSQHLRLFR